MSCAALVVEGLRSLHRTNDRSRNGRVHIRTCAQDQSFITALARPPIRVLIGCRPYTCTSPVILNLFRNPLPFTAQFPQQSCSAKTRCPYGITGLYHVSSPRRNVNAKAYTSETMSAAALLGLSFSHCVSRDDRRGTCVNASQMAQSRSNMLSSWSVAFPT